MLTDYKIYKYPHDVLTTPCLSVDVLGDSRNELVEWILGMYHFAQKPAPWGHFAGLAANQLGKSIRVFTAFDEIFINPVITWKTKAPDTLCMEGCYSLEEHKYDYPVKRSPSIKLKWNDLNGQVHEERFNGYKAQVIQHEMDHLNGKLCNNG